MSVHEFAQWVVREKWPIFIPTVLLAVAVKIFRNINKDR